jgi:hypothetical protein
MSGPEAIVHERVAKWRPILLSGQPVEDMFPRVVPPRYSAQYRAYQRAYQSTRYSTW